ncbi:uncharacterized protein BDW43DRAFT_308088 [Aspergillus alliaceus]|uniref:uncharacterized protein n=1 Tax=Petromyces alliaceus TaxID=209559 RepID=UPI0012A67E57|nr:uncharacterized protein BDW43DRAFT_308088 [Aspergillus alliaceus]KAB8236404.1 hypothetical protein BDW43DRAFT_308088 [Aspergillus alliaceus]
MAGAPEVGPPSSPSCGTLELYFSGSRQGVRLQHLDSSGVDSHREQSFGYRLALERKEALAWHLGASLVNDSFEDGFRKVDVLQDVEPSKLQSDVISTRHCLVRGVTVGLSASDCDIIRSGLLQRLIEPWPHPQDLQAEVEAVEATLRRLSTWKQNALQAPKEDEALARGLQERLISMRKGAVSPPDIRTSKGFIESLGRNLKKT